MMMMMKQSGSNLQAVVHLTGFEQVKGGFAISTDYVRRLEIPQNFELQDIKRAQKDCEILAAKLRDSPTEVLALLEASRQNKVDDAKQTIRKLGLTEQALVDQGGGLMWLVVIAVLLYATDAF